MGLLNIVNEISPSEIEVLLQTESATFVIEVLEIYIFSMPSFAREKKMTKIMANVCEINEINIFY